MKNWSFAFVVIVAVNGSASYAVDCGQRGTISERESNCRKLGIRFGHRGDHRDYGAETFAAIYQNLVTKSGSSYLFRVNQGVVDAAAETTKGARTYRHLIDAEHVHSFTKMGGPLFSVFPALPQHVYDPQDIFIWVNVLNFGYNSVAQTGSGIEASKQCATAPDVFPPQLKFRLPIAAHNFTKEWSYYLYSGSEWQMPGREVYAELGLAEAQIMTLREDGHYGEEYWLAEVAADGTISTRSSTPGDHVIGGTCNGNDGGAFAENRFVFCLARPPLQFDFSGRVKFVLPETLLRRDTPPLKPSITRVREFIRTSFCPNSSADLTRFAVSSVKCEGSELIHWPPEDCEVVSVNLKATGVCKN
jgi:hypothetical protein